MDSLIQFGIGLAIFVVVFSVALLVMTQTKTQIANTEGVNLTSTESVALNASTTLILSVASVPDWMPIVIITGMAVIILSFIVMMKTRE